MSSEAVVLDPPSERSWPGVLASLRSHVLAIVGGFLVGAMLGYFGSLLLPTRYTAEASFYLGVDTPFAPIDQGTVGDPVRFVADQAELVVTADVLQRAGDRVTPPLSVEEVRESVEATASTVTSRVSVSVERPDAEQARSLADAVVASYARVATQRVAAAASVAAEVVDDPILQEDIQLRATAYGDGVAVVEPAVLPDTPSAPRPLQNALLVGLLGMVLVTGLAVLRDQHRARKASIADLDLLLGAPLLTRYAEPRTASEVVSTDPSSDRLRAGQDVLMAIDVALEDTPRPSVLFLSWQLALTTTSLVVSVALAAARRPPQGSRPTPAPTKGSPVILIDGGLKERGISALTGVEPGLGLDALANPATPIGDVLRSWWVADTQLGIVPLDGSAAPTGAAARPQVLRSATARLQHSAAMTLVDGPPLTEHSWVSPSGAASTVSSSSSTRRPRSTKPTKWVAASPWRGSASWATSSPARPRSAQPAVRPGHRSAAARARSRSARRVGRAADDGQRVPGRTHA